MAERNPIEYKEFIKPDDSITNLIKQLEETQKTYAAAHELLRTEAAKSEAAIKKASVATEGGRDTVKEAAAEAEKLARANAKLNESRAEGAIKIARLKEQQRQQNNVNKLTAKLNAAAAGSYDKLSAQYSLNKIKLNAMSEAERKTTAAGKALEAETRALRTEMTSLQEATGDHTLKVGRYADALATLPGGFGAAAAGARAFGAQLWKLAKNPVLLILAALAAAFLAITSAMKRSEEGQNALNKVTTFFSVALDQVLDILTLLGIALFSALPKALKISKIAFEVWSLKLAGYFLQAKKAWADFTGDIEDTNALSKKLEENTAKTKALGVESSALAKSMSKDFDEITAKVKDFGNELERDMDAALRLADAEAKYNRTEREYIVANAKLNKESAEARRKSEALKLLDAQKSMEVLKESFELDEKVLKNEVALAKERQRILLLTSSLAVDDIAAKKELAEAEAKVFDLETKFDNLRRQRTRRLNQLRKEAVKQDVARTKVKIKLSELEVAEQIRANKRIIADKYATEDAKVKALTDSALIEADIKKRLAATSQQSLKAEFDLQLLNADDYAQKKLLIEKQLNDDLLKIAEKLEQGKLKAQQAARAAAKAEYTAKVKSFDGDKKLAESEIDLLKVTEAEKTKLKLEAERDRLEKIKALNEQAGGEMTKQQLQILDNQIQAITNKINTVEKEDIDIYSAVGLNLTDDKKQVIEDSTAFAIEQVNEFLQARVDSATEAVSASESETEAAQTALDAEIENRAQGYASNVDQAKKDLALAKKTQDKAIAEQAKAQKIQNRLNTISQVSNLVTAAAKIWKDLSYPWAIPAIALMFGSFAASKAKANKSAKTYGKGGLEFLEGGSHSSGRDINIGRTSDGRDRRAEGGEAMAIINKTNTAKYKHILPDVINALNLGHFEERFGGAAEVNVHTDNTGIERGVEQLRKQGEKRSFKDSQGRYTETYKNLKRTYR